MNKLNSTLVEIHNLCISTAGSNICLILSKQKGIDKYMKRFHDTFPKSDHVKYYTQNAIFYKNGSKIKLQVL